MTKIPFEAIDLNLARKDFFSALGVWFVLEVFSFLLLPGFRLIPIENQQSTWLAMSVPLGFIGAALIGICSQLIFICQEYLHGGNKKLWLWLGQLGGWLGLAGIGFPLAIVGLEIWLLLT